MDRFGAVTTWGDSQEGLGPVRGTSSHPSRRKVIAAIKGTLQGGSGPIVLTGDPGSGKTWVCHAVIAELSESYQTITVDLSPAIGPITLHRLILQRLGIEPASGLDVASARLDLENALSDDSAGGFRTILIVEEAHNASPEVFEELRILLNRRGRPDGFWGMVLIGQSSLARRLHSRSLAALSARVGGRVHLRAFDVIEFAESIRVAEPSSTESNRLDPLPLSDMPEPSNPELNNSTWESPAMSAVGARPPLHEEDGMIEVGWEPSSESAEEMESAAEDRSTAVEPILLEEPEELVASSDSVVDDLDEPIHDHYTALQAWNEWSKRQGRGDDEAVARGPAESNETGEEPETPPEGDLGAFWADGRQEFAPYSQLFSRLRKARDLQ